ncbi:MAG: hypothetical protein CL678_16850 [Bdellovibrionaceae bacterium]|nr:hypothetical protein [Pseudobdellovibrionaceae bacterium]|tara:strand:- start:5485 stop:6291 length:807 start_codon:yes stop_codon:yes gene_type:complete
MNSLLEIKNYKNKFNKLPKKIPSLYMEIINEYLLHAGDNIKLKNQSYYVFVLKRGLSTIKHIFNILLLYTKNINLTIHYCKKAYLYYVEFIGQIGESSNSYLQLNSKDATLFVYKKTIFEINNEYRKSFCLQEKNKLIYKYFNLSTTVINEIINYILDNEHMKEDTRISYIMYIQKMVSKILKKFNSINTDTANKILICEVYLYYKNQLDLLKLTDECKFLNLTLLFFKKSNTVTITKKIIKKKMTSSKIMEKIENYTPLKFTNWLLS